MHERFGHKNQSALGATGGQEALQNQAGFDGFTKTHFIGEEDARDLPI